ncbi:hypothetical protein D3C84_1122570 [compost metagenome]
MADRLDHFDRHQLVVLALQVAVVLQQQGDALAQAEFGDAPRRVGVLLPGQGGGGHPATVMAGGMDGHAAPAGADFQQVIAGF